MLKVDQNRQLARTLNRYLGTTPAAGTGRENFIGDPGCRWCPLTEGWVIVLPHDAIGQASILEASFKRQGFMTLSHATTDGGWELNAYLPGQGPKLQ